MILIGEDVDMSDETYYKKEISRLSDKNKKLKYKLNLLRRECYKLDFKNRMRIKELEKELESFKDYVFSDDEILCYSCVNCISKGIYEVECSIKGKVDVHGSCLNYWKNEGDYE